MPKIHQILILDQSGSMVSVKAATISGFNECVQTAKATVEHAEETHPERLIVLDGEEPQPVEPNFLVSLVLFNNKVTIPFFDSPVDMLDELSDVTYHPSGNTAMLDAIGQAINRMRRELGDTSTDKVLITILTDGEENSSVEFKAKEISDLLAEVQDKLGWTVSFIGANVDVNKMAADLHIDQSNVLSYTSDIAGTTSALRSLSGATANYISCCYDAKAVDKNFFTGVKPEIDTSDITDPLN